MAPLWGLSRMMAHRDGGDPAAVNRVMNVFLATLNDLGAETTRRFLRDNPSWREYTAMMLATSAATRGYCPRCGGRSARGG